MRYFVLVLLGVCLLVAAPAQAAWVSGVETTTIGAADVTFGVWDNPADLSGTGLTGYSTLDTSAGYLYLYQVEDDSLTTTSFLVDLMGLDDWVTSKGVLQGWGSGFSKPVGFPTPLSVSVTDTGLFRTDLIAAGVSKVFGFTSNLAPQLGPAAYLGGTGPGVGVVATVPEPSTVVALLGLVPFAGFAAYRRFRRK